MMSSMEKANRGLYRVRIPVSEKKDSSFDKQGLDGVGKVDPLAETLCDIASG